MNKKIKFISVFHFFILFSFTFLLSNCNSLKKAGETKLKKKTARFLLKKMDNNRLTGLEWFSSKAKIYYQDQDQSIKISTNIRWRKDSVLWLNIKKLGIEAARIQITPDSIYIIDRINNQYAIKDFSFIESRFNLAANFEVLQDFVLGNAILFDDRKMDASNNKESYQLFADTGSESNFSKSYLLNGVNFLLEKMVFNDRRYNRDVDMTFDGYEEIFENQNFSYIRKLKLNSQKTGEVSIDIKILKPEFNIPKNIKFEIPERYKRID